MGLSFAFTPEGFGTGLAIAALLWLPFSRVGKPVHPGALWLAAPLGGLFFLAGLLGVQVGVQGAVSSGLSSIVSPFTLAVWPVLVAGPLALVAGVVQEGARLAAIWLSLVIRGKGSSGAAWTGALVGAAIGMTEAAWLLSLIPVSHFTPWSEPVMERVLAVAFHTGAGALIGVGIARRKTFLFWGIAVVLHLIIDTGAGLYGLHHLSLLAAELVTGIVGVGLFLVSLWMLQGGDHALPAKGST